LTSISKSRAIEQIADYWDSQSLAEHWDETHSAALAVANGDATVLTHVVSHPEREPVRAGTERRLWRTAPWLIKREEI
jgi:hypothetical protein